ncbi:GntR family transcriptional regulator [Sphingomonas cannabina]|uniref:GntR family transcriptional regulator n=1 Tax=Sphingomonas cannabina TaxID=2899123 RepID=UPI001F2079C4|nr:GntR family transcriptional regulator [Sphingomonas cannabina]UIJ45330.1 GntR family transcriptional regulator [Sphingomonas cannabina]
MAATSAAAQDSSVAGSQRLSDLAYRKVLEGLFDRTVPAGAFVSQNDLVNLLGIPVQPLRDALRVLEAEGVLTIHPRSGIQFLKPDLELARSTYQFRTIIERAAARAYAETADADVVAGLIADHKALLADIEQAGFDGAALVRLGELEERLHGGMIASLRNPLVETTSRRLKNYVTLIRLDRLVTQPLALRTLREHLDILEAAAARDADAAEAALVGHFQAALQRILGMF